MLASTCRGTIDSYLFRIRRLTIRSSSRWPYVDFKMNYTAYDSPPLSILIFNHHWTKSSIGIIGRRRTYGRTSTISRVVKSMPVDGRGPDIIRSPSRI